jgi:hypothetical protein
VSRSLSRSDGVIPPLGSTHAESRRLDVKFPWAWAAVSALFTLSGWTR